MGTWDAGGWPGPGGDNVELTDNDPPGASPATRETTQDHRESWRWCHQRVRRCSTTRVLDVDEPADGEGGVVRLVHDLDEGVFLVLLGYRSIAWEIEETYPGSIQAVLYGCNDESTVEAPSTAEMLNTLGYYPCHGSGNWMDMETRILDRNMTDAGWPPLSSLHVIDGPSEITLSATDAYTDSETLPDCDSAASPVAFTEPDTSWVAATCPDLASDSRVCLTLTQDDIIAFGLDSGMSCVVGENQQGSSATGTHGNLAWFGTTLLLPGHDGAITELDLLSDSWRQSYSYSSGIARLGTRLFVRRDESHGGSALFDDSWLESFDSFEDVQCADGEPAWERPTHHTTNAMALTEELYIPAWHSADNLELYDRATGAYLRTLSMGGMDTYIYGLAVVDEEVLVIWRDTGVVRHRLDTGDVVDTIPFEDEIYGLACAPME